MNELRYILETHAARYPLMAPRDAVKLMYQNEFGCGHMVEGESESLKALIGETAEAFADGHVLPFEDIGNGYARINLLSAGTGGVSSEMINRMFVLSSRRSGCLHCFIEKLDILRDAAAEGIFAFSESELEAYLESYCKLGYPAVSHSDVYKNVYRPSYRVVYDGFARLLPAISAISASLEKKDRIIVGIDGDAAAGKTTSAELLAGLFGANVIHLDSFFLPGGLRTPERYAQAGGNIHYERFLSEAVAGLKSGEPFSYKIFDCSEMDYKETVTVEPKNVEIIEGSYSLHPLFGDLYDIRIFLAVSEEKQRYRIIARNGRDMYKKFAESWIPMEKRYFEAFGIREKSDFIL
jgi:uridine kinase